MFGIKKAGNLVFACSGKLSSALNEISGMFYSLETNQNEIMMSSSLGGNQNSNLYWKTWDLCIVSKLCLVCSKTSLRLGIWSCAYWYTFLGLKRKIDILLSGD